MKIGITNMTNPNPELDKAKADFAKLKSECLRHVKEKSELDKTVNTLTIDNSSLKKQVSASEFTIEKLEKLERKLRRELKEAKDEQNGNNGDIDGLQGMIQDQAQSLESKNVLLNKLQKDILDKDLSINHANEENERLTKVIKTMEQRSKTQTGQVKGDAKKLAATESELKRLEKQHEKAMTDLQKEVQRLNMRVQNQPKSAIFQMKAEFAETQKVNARMENEIEVLRTEMSGLEKELHKVQTRADKAQEKLKNWGEKAKDTQKVETAHENTEIPLEIPVKQEEGTTDVPTVEHLATSVSNEPGVTVAEEDKHEKKFGGLLGYLHPDKREPKLPSADAEAKGQGSKADISKLREPKQENGQISLNFSSALASITARASVASGHHKPGIQKADPFTEAHVSLERPTTPHDKEHDDSNSSVCSTTELSVDNRTPRALRRTLGQEGIQSRAPSTATDVSVTKCNEWVLRTANYVEKGMQTERLSLVKKMSVQMKLVPVDLMENMGVQTDPIPEKLIPEKLMENVGVQTDPIPEKLIPEKLMENMGVQTDPIPEKSIPEKSIPKKLIPEKLIPEKLIPEKLIPEKLMPEKSIPEKLMEDMGVQTDPIPEKSIPKKSIPEKSIPKKSIPKKLIPEKSMPEKSIPEKSMPEKSIPEKLIPEKLIPEKLMPEKSIPEKLMEDMGVQTDPIPEKSIPKKSIPEKSIPKKLIPEKSMPEKSIPEKSMPEKSIPEKLIPEKLMEDMGVRTDPVPAKPMKLMEKMGVQTDDVLVKLPNGEESSPEKDHGAKVKKGSETKSKEEIPKPAQNRWCCKIPSFVWLLMILFYLGLCYWEWSSAAANTAEINLWKSVNSAPSHTTMLQPHGSTTISALLPVFIESVSM